MDDAREAAMAMECVKVSMSQTKDGMKITLVIHPDDKGYANDLFSHPVGTRYQAALVRISEEGEPIPPKSKTDGDRAVVASAMLPREPAFLKWLHDAGAILEPTEEAAKAYIHAYCQISSRAELATNMQARKKFDDIRVRFAQSRGDFP